MNDAVERTPMGGWKTKVGAGIAALAGVSEAAAQICPDPETAMYCRAAAFGLGGVSALLVVLGLGHKQDKVRVAVREAITSAVSAKSLTDAITGAVPKIPKKRQKS